MTSHADTDHLRPMPLAELNECCGRLQVEEWAGLREQCQNCPLLIERRREHALYLARAL
ncbi:hypothetical protein [Bradyrhizobium retamae]|uniref:hypothetical protein n=1 Tax=Bradyrhizobium retamae TaxID=1300035 RepID=UPI000A5DFA68|nr:hypothetical protein [Bradyrhizobium retamae]